MDRMELEVGDIVFTIYGRVGEGWSPEPSDFDRPVPTGSRYSSIEEIYFALANLSLAEPAEA